MTSTLLTLICAILGSAGAFGTLQFLITRHDNKNSMLVQIKKEIEEMKASMERDKATDARRRILMASDEIIQGTLHSREWWEQTMDDITEYSRFCASHEKEYRNSKAEVAINELTRCYAERRDRHDFLI